MGNIHFIICNYNAELKMGSLGKSLEQLGKIKREGVFFHMVDNNSKDVSDEVIYRYKKDGVLDNVLLLAVNRGKAFALNCLYEFIDRVYALEDDDVVVSMDSDIIIYDSDFIQKIASAFSLSDVGYVGFNMFEDDACSVKSNYMKGVYLATQNIGEYVYQIVDGPSGLAGGVIAVRNKLYKNIKYNESLGRNGRPAVYGGDDAVLTLYLFKSGHAGLYDPFSRVVHYRHEDGYNEWKESVLQNMVNNGFGNSTIPDRGFYD